MELAFTNLTIQKVATRAAMVQQLIKKEEARRISCRMGRRNKVNTSEL